MKYFLVLFIAVVSCFTPRFASADTMLLNGAGASFPFPLYSKWFDEFHKKVNGIEINYQSIGSGAGVRQLLDKTIDFGASDSPMSDADLAKAQPKVIHIPTVMGAVVLTYNLPGMTQPLHLSGPTIAEIYQGTVSKWNDPKIASENAGVALPDADILVVYRSDGSGTTAVFTDYLSKVSADWKSKIGSSTSVKWPVGLGGKGNEGVTGVIKNSVGSIGYVEAIYALSNKLPSASIKNSSGAFISPTSKSVTAAATAMIKTMPSDFRVSITAAPGVQSYPISSFTYLLIYEKMKANKANAIKEFLAWALSEGQKRAEPLGYAPLPPTLLARVKARALEIKGE